MKLHLKTTSALIAALVATTSAVPQIAIAQDTQALPRHPAIEGSGNQTQSVNLLQDRVSVTVNSGGTLDASTSERDIDVTGNLSVDIDTPLGGTSIGGQLPDETANNPDGTAPGTQAANQQAANQNETSRAVGALDCSDNQAFGSILPAAAISQLGADTRLTVLVHCASSIDMTAEQVQALAGNPDLMQMLDRAHIAPDSIVALTVTGNGANQIHIVR